MTEKKRKKLEPKFRLDMDFAEALERFTRTDPKEVAESIERAKQKKPPGDKAPGGRKSGLKDKPRKSRQRQPSRGASGD